MALPSKRIQTLVAHFVNYLGRGQTYAEAWQSTKQAFGIRDNRDFPKVNAEARKVRTSANRVQRLSPTDPISAGVPDYQSLGNTVGVRVIYNKPAGAGGRRTASVVYEANWDETIEDILQAALEELQGASGGTEGATTADLVIVGGVRYPPQQSQ